MSLWGTITGWISGNTTTTTATVTAVETEEIKESCGDLFESMCRDAGVKQEWLDARNAISIFEDWYTGTCDAAEIKASINDFINANPTFRAKLKGKF